MNKLGRVPTLACLVCCLWDSYDKNYQMAKINAIAMVAGAILWSAKK